MAKPRRDNSKLAIMDAAEQIFAARGFGGASVRDICRRARVNSGLIAYYFGTKEKLLAEVVERRRDDLLATFASAMATITPDGSGENYVYDSLHCYTAFLLSRAASPEWGAYLRLLVKLSIAYDEQAVGEILRRFDAMPALVLAHLRKGRPDLSREALQRGLFYLEAALTTIIASDHLWTHRLNPGLNPGMDMVATDDHAAVARHIARFFADRLQDPGPARDCDILSS